jgi:hypothetical protein
VEIGSTFFLYREAAWASGATDVTGCLGDACGVPTLVQSIAIQFEECARIFGGNPYTRDVARKVVAGAFP